MFGYLKKLRQSRKGLIENVVNIIGMFSDDLSAGRFNLNESFFFQDQYKFVYDTLEEFVVCGVSWFPVKDLSNRLKQKSMKNPLTKLNEYQREFQVSILLLSCFFSS